MTTALIQPLVLAWLLAAPAAAPPGAAAGPAEPAPAASPAPGSPAPAAPSDPTPQYPSPTPVSPSPAAPPPPAGPAQPAPAAAAPVPPAPEDPTSLTNTASLWAGVADRLGTVLGPNVGFAFTASFNHRYALPARTLALGLQVDFSFDRFTTSVVGITTDFGGQPQMFNGTRSTTETGFALLQTLQVQIGAASHLWAGLGGGLSIGYLSSPEVGLAQETWSASQPFARAIAGGDFPLDAQTSVGARVGYAKMLTSATVDGGGARWELVGDLLDIQAGLSYRFH